MLTAKTRPANGGCRRSIRTGTPSLDTGLGNEHASIVVKSSSNVTRSGSARMLVAAPSIPEGVGRKRSRVSAPSAETCSSARPADLGGRRVPTSVLALSATKTEDCLANSIRTGRAASACNVSRDTCWSMQARDYQVALSTASSWRRLSAARWRGTRKYITKTPFAATTGLRIWSCGLNASPVVPALLISSPMRVGFWPLMSHWSCRASYRPREATR